MIERTIQFFEETPLDIQHQAHFDWTRMEELAVDVRAHDHLHPVNKRTNYMFGEWDPHLVNTKGFYTRFVVRQIILDALLNWMQETRRTNKSLAEEEILFDASAVLCGTMLMASSISGSGPGVHDSSITLTSLLPQVAHQRDAFYARLLEEAKGARAKRLLKEAKQTQQPFGHVRQRLNIELAKYGAKQMQTRHLAQMFARMGYPEASRRQANVIPSASARFECEIEWRITDAHQEVEHGGLDTAVARIREIEDHLHRGIECGALIDPWNILGFQGQFPLFTSREDALHDIRAVEMIETMERIFRVYSQTLSEAAAQGNSRVQKELSERFESLAAWWDKFATTTVTDLPEVSGEDSVQSARHVAETLRAWQEAGAAAGDISFWKKHVNRFQSAKAYALVVDALLERGDQVASMALLMQWLNQAEFVGLDSGPYSIFSRLTGWMRLAVAERPGGSRQSAEELERLVSRMFAFLEANAGEFWHVPTLAGATGMSSTPKEEAASSTHQEDELFDEDLDEEEDDLFAAAYDDMIFRDSADDGQMSDTVDEGGRSDDTSFEIIARYLEPRMQFLETVAELWQMAAAGLAPHLAPSPSSRSEMHSRPSLEFEGQLQNWLSQARRWQEGLRQLRKAVWQRPISLPSGDHDSNVEYDEQLQTKFYLLHGIISTDINCETAERSLQSCLPQDAVSGYIETLPDAPTRFAIVEIYRGILTRNAALVKRGLPELLESLIKQPLLYVPLNNDGEPEQVRAAQSLQSLIRFLLMQMPRLGLLRETWTLLKTAYRMERKSRPGGQAVTEFDQLFRTALRNSLDCVIRSSKRWRVSRGRPAGFRTGGPNAFGANRSPRIRPKRSPGRKPPETPAFGGERCSRNRRAVPSEERPQYALDQNGQRSRQALFRAMDQTQPDHSAVHGGKPRGHRALERSQRVHHRIRSRAVPRADAHAGQPAGDFAQRHRPVFGISRRTRRSAQPHAALGRHGSRRDRSRTGRGVSGIDLRIRRGPHGPVRRIQYDHDAVRLRRPVLLLSGLPPRGSLLRTRCLESVALQHRARAVGSPGSARSGAVVGIGVSRQKQPAGERSPQTPQAIGKRARHAPAGSHRPD